VNWNQQRMQNSNDGTTIDKEEIKTASSFCFYCGDSVDCCAFFLVIFWMRECSEIEW
jgi:hypothetical protein